MPFLAESRALLSLWLYPIKIGVVLGALLYGWCRYDELHDKLFASLREGVVTIGAGVVVYLAWVRMDWSWATLGQGAGSIHGKLARVLAYCSQPCGCLALR